MKIMCVYDLQVCSYIHKQHASIFFHSILKYILFKALYARVRIFRMWDWQFSALFVQRCKYLIWSEMSNPIQSPVTISTYLQWNFHYCNSRTTYYSFILFVLMFACKCAFWFRFSNQIFSTLQIVSLPSKLCGGFDMKPNFIFNWLNA